MKNLIGSRINLLIEDQRLTKSKFAQEIGVGQSRISNITTGKNNPDAEVLIKIAQKFRYLNMRWLLIGEGPMWLSPELDQAILQEDGAPYGEPALWLLLQDLRARVEILEKKLEK